MINTAWPDPNRLTALRATPELAAWPDRSLLALLPQFDEVTLPAGRVIAVEGRPGTEFVIVLHGRLSARAGSSEPRQLLAGDSSGWRAMWERGPNEATVVVESEARVLVMGHAQFRAIKAEAGGRAA
jgi:CRP-like cAMP-binding protein